MSTAGVPPLTVALFVGAIEDGGLVAASETRLVAHIKVNLAAEVLEHFTTPLCFTAGGGTARRLTANTSPSPNAQTAGHGRVLRPAGPIHGSTRRKWTRPGLPGGLSAAGLGDVLCCLSPTEVSHRGLVPQPVSEQQEEEVCGHRARPGHRRYRRELGSQFCVPADLTDVPFHLQNSFRTSVSCKKSGSQKVRRALSVLGLMFRSVCRKTQGRAEASWWDEFQTSSLFPVIDCPGSNPSPPSVNGQLDKVGQL